MNRMVASTIPVALKAGGYNRRYPLSMRRRLPQIVITVALIGSWPTPADAETLSPSEATHRARAAHDDRYVRGTVALLFGRGIRLNNPYRLSTELGSTPESLSLTSTYIDLGVAVLTGRPDGFQYGASVHASKSIEGVSEFALAPSFSATLRSAQRLQTWGRIGPAFAMTPSTSSGVELALGSSYFVTSSMALLGECVGDVFFGAGTRERRTAVYPVMSAQLGILFDVEWL